MEINFQDFFNRLKWDRSYADKRDEFEITYTHRGAPNDAITINYTDIEDIKHDGFVYRNERTGFNTFIPYHRIKKIENFITNETLYRQEEK